MKSSIFLGLILYLFDNFCLKSKYLKSGYLEYFSVSISIFCEIKFIFDEKSITSDSKTPLALANEDISPPCSNLSILNPFKKFQILYQILFKLGKLKCFLIYI